MRLGALIVSACGALTAQASYELVMVADRLTKSVHRFDGVTGSYFGSFGSGFLNAPVSMCIDQATNSAYVMDNLTPSASYSETNYSGHRIVKFNYNTGEYISSFKPTYSYNRAQVGYFQGQLIVGTDGSLIDAYDPSTGGFKGTYTMSVSGGAMAVSTSLGRVFSVGYSGSGAISTQNFGGTSQINYPIASAPPTTVVRQMAISGDRALVVGGTPIVSKFTPSTLNSAATNNLTFSTGTGLAGSLGGVGFGHGDIAYVSEMLGAGSAKITRMYYSEFALGGSFGAGILQEPRSIAVVVAPEPTTWLAMGIGLAILARRRRR